MKDHIESMKFREQEQRRLASEAILKAETIQRERMELENFLDKQNRRANENEARIRSLIGK